MLLHLLLLLVEVVVVGGGGGGGGAVDRGGFGPGQGVASACAVDIWSGGSDARPGGGQMRVGEGSVQLSDCAGGALAGDREGSGH